MSEVMKRKLSIISIVAVVFSLAVVMISCKSSPKTDAFQNQVLGADTTGLADFQAWKALNERKDPSLYNSAAGYAAAPVATAPKAAAPRRATTTTRRAPVYTAPAPVAVAQPAKKKGWSKAAKGAAIGGAAGAVAGAIINKKNRVLGAVIGGVVGGGGGYVIGRGMDKKDGRY
jgi:hypothetical protein